jgi:hypothetical protein
MCVHCQDMSPRTANHTQQPLEDGHGEGEAQETKWCGAVARGTKSKSNRERGAYRYVTVTVRRHWSSPMIECD